MTGDPVVGLMLRQARKDRGLTLATVAREVGCTESLLSLVETGRRSAQPWLLHALDTRFAASGAVLALARATQTRSEQRPESGGNPPQEMLMVTIDNLEPPDSPDTHASRPGVAISRRTMLAALAVGGVVGPSKTAVEDLLQPYETSMLLAHYRTRLAAFQKTARTLSSPAMIDAMTSDLIALDVLSQRPHGPRQHQADSREIGILKARYAESLSWLHEERHNVTGAVFWVDRAAAWSQMYRWQPMTAYTLVRRSMIALSLQGDPALAQSATEAAAASAGASSWVRGLAAKQSAFTHALMNQPQHADRDIVTAMLHLNAEPGEPGEDTHGLGQHSVPLDDLHRLYRATTDLYLGRGEDALSLMQPDLNRLGQASRRTQTITSAKAALALALTGQAAQASIVLEPLLPPNRTLRSASADREISRTLTVLKQWQHRTDVKDLLARARTNAADDET